jgi:hypothetical protein
MFWFHPAAAGGVGYDIGAETISPCECVRPLQALNFDHRQIVEAALICAEAKC